MNLESLKFRLYGDDSPGASVLRVNQVLELAQSTPVMAVGNIINSGLTAGLFYTSMPLPLLAGWVALVWLFSAARLQSWWHNRRRPRPASMSRRPLLRSTFWAATAGALWGLMAFILLQNHEMPLHVFVAFVVGGQAAAVAIWIAPLPAAGLAYILLSMIPVVAGFAMEGDFLHLAMAGMLTTYTALLIVFMRNTYGKFVDVILSGFERERLVVQLETAHAQLEERVRQRTAELSGINRRLEQEIEERRLAEEEVLESRDQLRLITDNLPVLISYMDAEQRFVFVNKCLVDWYGRPREELLGRQLNQLVGQASYEKFAPGIEAALAGKTVAFEEVVEYPGGITRNVDIKYVPDIADDGKVRGYFGLVVDITERKKAEAELRESQERISTITDSVPVLISYVDQQHRFQFNNRAYADWFGKEPEEFMGQHLRDVLGDEAYEKILPHVEGVLAGEEQDYEMKIPYKDAVSRFVKIRYIPHFGEKKEVLGFYAAVVDITEQKQAEEALRENQRLLQTVFDVIPHWIFVKDTNSRYLMVNNAFAESYGLTPEDFNDKHTLEMPTGTEQELALFVDTDQQVLKSGVGLDMMTYPATLPDGRRRISHSHKLPIKDDAGNIIGVVGVLEDVTQRVEAEEKLRQNEYLQQSVFDAIPVPTWFKDAEGRFKMVNKAMCSLLNLPQETVVGKTVVDLSPLPPDIIARIESDDRLALETRQLVDLIDQKLELPNGDVIWQHIIRAPLIDGAGDVAGLVGVALDTTDRVLAEKAVLRREQQLRAVIENIPAAIFFKDKQGQFVLANKVFEEWCNLPAGEIVGKTSQDIFDSDTAESFVRHDGQVLADQKIISSEYTLLYPDGVSRTVLNFKFPVYDEAGTLIGVGAVGLDHTDRKRAEEELLTSERRYHTLASTVPVGIFRTDAQGQCLYVNEQWCHITGLSPEEAIGEGWTQATHPEDREELSAVWNAAVQAGQPFRHEYRYLRPDGTTATVLGQSVAEYGDSEQIAGYVGSITDITESARLEEQLRQSQKMEAVGQLAGGVAHDFNNILQIIISYVHLANASIDSPENLPKYLDNIRKSADRAANLTRQLLTFSRKDMLQPKILDINELISNLMRMLGRLLGENIEMEILPGSELLAVNADPGMLEQVLVNLSVNARDAMPGGGRLVIETSAFHADEEYCRIHGWQRPGKYLLISVSDTGEGMTEEVRDHIFEPFFTTKEPGKGTGLGLSMVYSIIEQHEGIIAVYSEPGMGSSFRIYLPAVEGQTSTQEEQKIQDTPGGTETILIAEDEEAVRELLSELLEAQGYRVLLAPDGEQAVALYSSRKETIDLVIMDVVMPKLSGRKAYDQIREMDSRVPIVFSTGYAANALDKEFLEENGLTIIHKPYSPALLYQTVREEIDRASEASQGTSRTA